MFRLSRKEKEAIQKLKEVAEIWPDTLWLFSASGSLCVMRTNKNGEHAKTNFGGVDPNFLVDEVNIPNDGGDW